MPFLRGLLCSTYKSSSPKMHAVYFHCEFCESCGQGHAFRILGEWLSEHTDIREALNRDRRLTLEKFFNWMDEIDKRIAASGRDYPVRAVGCKEEAARLRQERKLAAIEEQKREEDALAALSDLVSEESH